MDRRRFLKLAAADLGESLLDLLTPGEEDATRMRRQMSSGEIERAAGGEAVWTYDCVAARSRPVTCLVYWEQ
eukprot:1985809-Pyramimonas_sp.AAC.2